ncbi:hypothetical protein BC829DRAFT_458836 [Chytridium lagenaria]|nr:hypothetical protein BC829DRAFT_458836 [Chytridium lagenaria]
MREMKMGGQPRAWSTWRSGRGPRNHGDGRLSGTREGIREQGMREAAESMAKTSLVGVESQPGKIRTLKEGEEDTLKRRRSMRGLGFWEESKGSVIPGGGGEAGGSAVAEKGGKSGKKEEGGDEGAENQYVERIMAQALDGGVGESGDKIQGLGRREGRWQDGSGVGRSKKVSIVGIAIFQRGRGGGAGETDVVGRGGTGGQGVGKAVRSELDGARVVGAKDMLARVVEGVVETACWTAREDVWRCGGARVEKTVGRQPRQNGEQDGGQWRVAKLLEEKTTRGGGGVGRVHKRRKGQGEMKNTMVRKRNGQRIRGRSEDPREGCTGTGPKVIKMRDGGGGGVGRQKGEGWRGK